MTIFSRIIAGEIPCYKIYEDEYIFAFLDIHPHTLGHTLVVPKIEVDHFSDLPEPYYTALFHVAKKISKAIQSATWCERVGAIFAGFDVPHVHYHLIPMTQSSDLDFARAHTESAEAMTLIAEKIRQALPV